MHDRNNTMKLMDAGTHVHVSLKKMSALFVFMCFVDKGKISYENRNHPNLGTDLINASQMGV